MFFTRQNFLYTTRYSTQLSTIASTSLMESISFMFSFHDVFTCASSQYLLTTYGCNRTATTVPQATAPWCISPLPMYADVNYTCAATAFCVITTKKPRSIQDILFSSGQRENTSLWVLQFSAHCNYQMLGSTMQRSS